MGDLLKIPDVAKRLAVSQRHVRDLIAEGELPDVRIGKAIRIKPEALEAWLSSGGSGKTEREVAKAAA